MSDVAWALDRHGVGLFNFGFGIMFEPGIYHESFKYTGIKHFANYPVPAPMSKTTESGVTTSNRARRKASQRTVSRNMGS